MNTRPSIQSYRTNQGGRIYQIPLLAFPGLWAYVYLVFCEDLRALIDTGSGYGESNQHLIEGLEAAGELETGKPFNVHDLTHILLTHGHIDHFGGLNYLRTISNVPVGIHELDRRVLTNYEERLTLVTRRLGEFLVSAGVNGDRRDQILSLYRITKGLFQSTPVDFTYETIGMTLGPLECLHVPGHCAGHVVIRLHDILFSGDHILDGITPHQAPEHLTLGTGLEHYLHSLELLKTWADGITLTLGGHRRPIRDLSARIDEIKRHHQERLELLLDLLKVPRTIAELAWLLFGEVTGYNTLLALEETGAHIEFLHERGLLRIVNFEALENTNAPLPLVYQRT